MDEFIPKIHCKSSSLKNHGDSDTCYGQQTVIQYANSGIRSEAEIKDEKNTKRLSLLGIIISCSMA